MRRWIALLLMLLLPLQVSWSVAAEYGMHGATIGAPHAEMHADGHHHADGAEASAPSDTGSAPADCADALHTCCDLHQCHTHGSFAAITATADFSPLASAASYATERVGRMPRGEAARIERPQWAASPIPR